MKGLDEFLNIFGDVTVLQAVELIIAIVFLFGIYKQVKKYFDNKAKEALEKAEAEKTRDAKIKEALDAVHKYPQYRQQSIDIQHKLESQIQELKDLHKDTATQLNTVSETVHRMEETETRRERNKMRDTLLQSHRYYTNPNTNPSGSWTRVESETFWELYSEYEAAGGNGYMHTDVVPAMKLLKVIDIGEE